MMLPFDFFQLWISNKIFKELDATLLKTVRPFIQGIQRLSRLKLKFSIQKKKFQMKEI